MSIVLMGFQGVGKTTLGRNLAKRYHLPFYDTDALVLRRCGGLSCKEVVAENGLAHFRALEKVVIQALISTVPSVIALGGGAILDQGNVMALKKHGRLIYLRVPKHVAKERCRLRFADFETIYSERHALYEAAADQTIDRDPTCQEIPLELCLRS